MKHKPIRFKNINYYGVVRYSYIFNCFKAPFDFDNTTIFDLRTDAHYYFYACLEETTWGDLLFKSTIEFPEVEEDDWVNQICPQCGTRVISKEDWELIQTLFKLGGIVALDEFFNVKT